GADYGLDVTVDADGRAYLTGETGTAGGSGAPFPRTPGAWKTMPAPGDRDAFVAKFDTGAVGAASLVYATLLGGNDTHDHGYGIAVDAAGNAAVVGRTVYSGISGVIDDFPTTTNAYQPARANTGVMEDGFVAQLNSAGSALRYATFLGGTGPVTGPGSYREA